MKKPSLRLSALRRPRHAIRGEDPEVMMDINTTPLIDVMLVLLVMLIITIPIQLHAVNLALPVGVPPASLAPAQKVRIDIDERSTVLWQGQAVGPEELAGRLAQLASLPQPPEVHVRPHKASQYAVFASVLSATRRAGLTKVAVIGSEQFVP